VSFALAYMAKSARMCLLTITGALLVAGCGSIGGRGGEGRYPVYPGVYPGVRNDAHFIAHREDNDMPDLWWFKLVDLPFSAALDTVLLPWDLPYWAFQPTPCTNSVSR
jgi:uncharacterized protein YceK